MEETGKTLINAVVLRHDQHPSPIYVFKDRKPEWVISSTGDCREAKSIRWSDKGIKRSLTYLVPAEFYHYKEGEY